MPRKLKDTRLDTRAARLRLKPRRDPYWRLVSMGCHLGYRRNKSGSGTWVGRFYDGRRYVKSALAAADDTLPADGVGVLDFTQAQERARAWFAQKERQAAGLPAKPRGRYTVANCMEEYLDWYKVHRRNVVTVQGHIRTHILPALGKRPVDKLTTEEIRKWHQGIAETPPRLRTAPGEPQCFAEIVGSEGVRKRKNSANHALTTLKAGLNMAFREGKVGSDTAWRRVRPFKGVDAPRIAFLDADEARRLLAACRPDFRRLVRGALLTGCRYGELCRMRVGDYHSDNQSVYVPETKVWKPRDVFISDQGAAFFESVTAGRSPSDRFFLRANGEPWGKSHQARRIKRACEVAEIEPPISFHILRHTYASHYLMNGGSLPALSKQLGHADTRMTIRHYGHLADQWRAEEARRHAPSFGANDPSNVVKLTRALSI